ncbi:hypothetical protein IJJ53_00875, partial [Candidatus Saccharibacteria bacterium]|nr:hypothetical protein [Candidatus Saccharibacteria bacterium]
YKAYWVTKLLDGHIWMTQNLAIDLSIGENEDKTPIMRTFTSEDTDLNTIHDETTGSYAEYNDGYSYNSTSDIISWTPANSAATIDFTGTNVPGWQRSNTAPASASKTDSTETGHASPGNYYNWSAAIASNNSSTLSKNPKNSICPKGWRLPTISNQSNTISGSTNEFARLNYLYNNNKTSGENADNNLLTAPLWFVKNGRIIGSLTNYDFGGYWSSTLRSSDFANNLGFSNTNVAASTYDYRNYGWNIRCVVR